MTILNAWLKEAITQQNRFSTTIDEGKTGEFILCSAPLINFLVASSPNEMGEDELALLTNWLDKADTNRARANIVGPQFLKDIFPSVQIAVNQGCSLRVLPSTNRKYSSFWSVLAKLGSPDGFWQYWDAFPDQTPFWSDLVSGSPSNPVSSLFNKGGEKEVYAAFDRGLTLENISLDVLMKLTNHKALEALASRGLVISISDQEELLKGWKDSRGQQSNTEFSKLREVLLKSFTSHLSAEDKLNHFLKDQWKMPVGNWNKAIKLLGVDPESESFRKKMWQVFLETGHKDIVDFSKAPSDWLSNHWPTSLEEKNHLGHSLLVSCFVIQHQGHISRHLDVSSLKESWDNEVASKSKEEITLLLLEEGNSRKGAGALMPILPRYSPVITPEITKKYLYFLVNKYTEINTSAYISDYQKDIKALWEKIFDQGKKLSEEELKEIASPSAWSDFALSMGRNKTKGFFPEIIRKFGHMDLIVSEEECWVEMLARKKMLTTQLPDWEKRLKEACENYSREIGFRENNKAIYLRLQNAFVSVDRDLLQEHTPHIQSSPSSGRRRL